MPEIRVPIEELRKQKLFLATPMYGGACAGIYTRSVADLVARCAAVGIQLHFHFLFNESLITRARNYCCDDFLRTDCTHMIFIDSDIGFAADDVIGMLALQVSNPEYDILGAPYPKKCLAWEKLKAAVDKGFADKDPTVLERFVGDFVFNPKANATSIPLDKPAEVLEIGTGFMMMRRETLLTFRERYGSIYDYKPDHVRTAAFDGSREIVQFFQAEIDVPSFEETVGPVARAVAVGDKTPDDLRAALADYEDAKSRASKRYLSEDYWFCQKAQKIGLKVWLCPWMKTQHVGSYVFGGSLSDLAQIGASATADVSQLKKR